MTKIITQPVLFGLLAAFLHSGAAVADANNCQTETKEIASSVVATIAKLRQTQDFFVPETGVQTTESARGMYDFVGYVGTKATQVDVIVIVNSQCDPTEIKID